jgi:hypothetical protein
MMMVGIITFAAADDDGNIAFRITAGTFHNNPFSKYYPAQDY